MIIKIQDKIKKLRKNKGLVQKQLAEMVGINTAHLSRLETGKYQPSIEVLKNLADALHVSTDYLLNDTDEEEKYKYRIKHLPIESRCWTLWTKKKPLLTQLMLCLQKRSCSIF